jgi:F-type H+-transporting ATPase subunit delta
VAESASLSAGIAGRYATALFEIARDSKSLGPVEAELDALAAALAESAGLRDLVASPVYSREDQAGVMSALAAKMGLSSTVTNTIGLMAAKRRLFVLPQMISGFKDMAAAERGEVTAEVTAAKALTKAQQDTLARSLKAATGKDVVLKVNVDGSLIGGLIVKVGSRMIDSSISSKLNALHNAMKEVG